jgi:acetoin utilization deacetylase AcuC-like enzyme
MSTPAKGGMKVFFHEAMLAFRAPDGVFECASSELLEIQTPHAEGPDRIANMRAILQRSPIAGGLRWAEPAPASDEDMLRFHTPEFLAELKDADKEGRWFGRTTYLPAGGLEGVRLAAGAAIAAARDVADGREKVAYALVRPPFHHAQPDRADGYCFVNGVGLAALTAIAAGHKRVAIVDWDVHHGNGTQEGFYGRDNVLTVSLHMDHGAWGASHPQTGGVEEIGEGAGEGFNVNLPLPFGAGDRAYALAFERCVEPIVRKFAPDMIVLANGQDANQFDPNGRQMLTMAGFHDLANRLRALAGELCEGRIAVTQEGGYNIAYAPYCAYAVAAGLIGRELEIPDPLAFYPEDDSCAEADVEALIKRHPLLG